MLKEVIPILRIFDEAKAIEFYVDYLGFRVDWKHRFEADMPLYMQVSLDETVIHLSEHHGDCTPGSAIRIHANKLDEYYAQLLLQDYKYARPRIEDTPWNLRELRVTDPFGNRIVFYEPQAQA